MRCRFTAALSLLSVTIGALFLAPALSAHASVRADVSHVREAGDCDSGCGYVTAAAYHRYRSYGYRHYYRHHRFHGYRVHHYPVRLVSYRAASAPVQAASGSFQACVIARESGGNARAVNPSSAAGGLYQFLPSTYHALGFSGLPQNASVATQTAAFNKEVALTGHSAWSPYDGC